MKSSKKPDAPGLNILSYIRVRPLNDKEKKSHHLEFGRKEIIIRGSPIKTLTYDRVFDVDSKQISVYNTVVHPMIKEVLQGYNCTVFAYGQTGTGKTYTMTGHQGSSDGSLVDNVDAGIIPRAMDEIFKELLMIRAEYQVAVQYIELYNEKLRSLLSNTSEDTNVQLIDLPEGGVFIKGVPLTPVKNKDDAFNFLCQGADKRQMASTLINENSSRSHTIFVITVKIKETVVAEQEDVVRVGKLYLVDLAGSENVSKSGANDIANKTNKGQNQRLAEASNINKSLLTLGRVITSLTENNSHVPYRESKLTRILRDSLGGKTKTCIIGTISPSQANVDETESTLNYACKARSIKNKPEKNQTISKKEFMQVASEEILKLKRDLEAVRQGDGFYISQETHEEMCLNMRALETQVQDWNDRYNKLYASYEEKKIIFDSLSIDYSDKCAEYEELDQIFKSEEKKFKAKVAEIEKGIFVREYLIKEYEKTEDQLTDQAKACKTVLESLVHNSGLLHDKIDRKKTNEHSNHQLLDEFKENVSNQMKNFKNEMTKFYAKERDFSNDFVQFTKCITDRLNEEYYDLFKMLEEFKLKTIECDKEAESNCSNMVEDMGQQLHHQRSLISESVNLQTTSLQSLLDYIKPAFEQMFEHFLLISRTIESGSQKLKEHTESRTKLENEMSDLTKKWELSLQQMLNSFSLLIRNQEESLEIALRRKEEDELMVEKSKELMKLQEEMFELVKKSFENGLRTEDGIRSTLESSENTKAQVIREVKSCQSSSMDLFDKLKKLNIDNSKVQEELVTEVKPLFEKALEDKSLTAQHMREAVEKSFETIQCHSLLTKDNINHFEETVNGISKVIKGNIQLSQSLSQEFVNNCSTKLKKNEEVHENLLRSHYDTVHHNLNEVLSNETYTNSVVNDVRSTVSRLAYKEDTPLGTTPQRKAIQNLQYPDQFLRTAPRAMLEQKYQKELELAAASVDCVESEDIVENTNKNLISSLLPLQKICSNNTPQDKTQKKKRSPKLRRSNSLPHLQLKEEKENRRETVLVAPRTRGVKKTTS